MTHSTWSLPKAELLGHRVGDRRLEALAVGRVVVDEPRLVRRRVGGDGQHVLPSSGRSSTAHSPRRRRRSCRSAPARPRRSTRGHGGGEQECGGRVTTRVRRMAGCYSTPAAAILAILFRVSSADARMTVMARDAGAPDIAGYLDLTRIGRGGFATVYRAREIAFDRDVAIKVLDVHDLATEDSSASSGSAGRWARAVPRPRHRHRVRRRHHHGGAALPGDGVLPQRLAGRRPEEGRRRERHHCRHDGRHPARRPPGRPRPRRGPPRHQARQHLLDRAGEPALADFGISWIPGCTRPARA